MHWESAESGAQQVVGCSGWFSSCICPHADEVISGIMLFFLLLSLFYLNHFLRKVICTDKNYFLKCKGKLNSAMFKGVQQNKTFRL